MILMIICRFNDSDFIRCNFILYMIILIKLLSIISFSLRESFVSGREVDINAVSRLCRLRLVAMGSHQVCDLRGNTRPAPAVGRRIFSLFGITTPEFSRDYNPAYVVNITLWERISRGN